MISLEALADWPDKVAKNPLIAMDDVFKNDAGLIVNLGVGEIGSASFIHSQVGSVRSNHYHQTDWHLIYVTSGLMYYYWRPANSNEPCGRVRVGKGQAVFTPPLVEHATYFPVDTEMLTLQRWRRDHAHHEADLIRVPPLVTTEVCPAVMMGVKCCLPFETHRQNLNFNNVHNSLMHESADGQIFAF